MTQRQQNNTNAGDNKNINNTQTSNHGYQYGAYTSPSITTKNHLPAFLNKLYGMVNSPETDPWVHWNEEGTSFIIPNHQELAERVLGRHFKHNNFASFVRQLNMYGFHKVPHLNHGILHNDGLPEVWEFINENFQRDHPEYLTYIVRKKGEAEKARSAAKHGPTSPASPLIHHFNDAIDVAIVHAEVQNVASRQNMIRDEVFRIKSRQDELWKFALETRQQYVDQQGKIDAIIKFLSEAFNRKRTSPTMAGAELPNKVRGLIEPAEPSVFEELSETNSPSVQTPSTPTAEQTALEIMKMLANGKVPVGFHEAVQQYLMNLNANQQINEYATPTPITPITPTTFDSSDALIHSNAMHNAQQLNQAQLLLTSEDPNISSLSSGLGIDLNSNDLNHPLGNINMGNNEDYTSFLLDAHFQLDSFIPNPDPALDIFSTDTVHSAWQTYLDNTDMAEDINAFSSGRKRTYDEQEEDLGEYSSGKKARA